MQYQVIVEHENGIYRALIPNLPGLLAEGATRDEAVGNARRAAEAYLSEVEITNIEIHTQQEPSRRPGSPQAVLQAAGMFADDEAAMLQHIEAIYAERRNQRAEAEREADV